MSFSFKPLWKQLIDKNMSAEDLRKALNFSFSTMSKMKKGENVSLEVLDRICTYLNCQLQDIVEHIPKKE
ncbi:MAG: XRE family transcriptional regulator [Gracilibacter sp. BRH_c7a]|nr:MAG: XRE family transcriptional regulator [Gracilibacter sp. BRH_c7a]